MSIIPQNLTQEKIPSTPGIYAIVNLVNQHVYVGSAVVLAQRKRQHLSDLRKGKHGNGHLQNAYNLYGADAFIFYVIEQFDQVENLIPREQYYLDVLDPHYNIVRTAGNNLGMQHSPETKSKISSTKREQNLLPSAKEKNRAAQLGKKMSPEAKSKIGAANLGKKLSSETKAKLSEAHRGRTFSLEHKAKLSEAKLLDEKTSERLAKATEAARLTNTGKKRPPDVVAKIKATWAAKRAAKLAEQQTGQSPLL